MQVTWTLSGQVSCVGNLDTAWTGSCVGNRDTACTGFLCG